LFIKSSALYHENEKKAREIFQIDFFEIFQIDFFAMFFKLISSRIVILL